MPSEIPTARLVLGEDAYAHVYFTGDGGDRADILKFVPGLVLTACQHGGLGAAQQYYTIAQESGFTNLGVLDVGLGTGGSATYSEPSGPEVTLSDDDVHTLVGFGVILALGSGLEFAGVSTELQ
jgi:hypothetical protein